MEEVVKGKKKKKRGSYHILYLQILLSACYLFPWYHTVRLVTLLGQEEAEIQARYVMLSKEITQNCALQ